MAGARRTPHPTLRQVADAAGTSLATASRALGGHPYVTDALRERVEEAARTLGYYPNEGARGLRTARTMTLGVLCYQLRQLPIVDFIDGFGAKASEAGYAVLVANARGDEGQYQMLAQRMMERRIDGLIVTSPGELSGSLQAYEDAGIPVAVTLWRGPREANIPLITTSELPAIRNAMTTLRERNHRSIAFYGTSRTVFMQRPAALSQASTELGLRCHMAFIDESTDADAMTWHIQQVLAPPVSATTICFNHSLVSPAMRAFRKLGLRIPDDVSVFVFNDYQDKDNLLEPPLSSIHTDVVTMGSRSADLIVNWIESGAAPAASITDLDLTTWVDSGTIGLAPQP